MSSLTLCPRRQERSRMSHHLPGWLFLGITISQIALYVGTETVLLGMGQQSYHEAISL